MPAYSGIPPSRVPSIFTNFIPSDSPKRRVFLSPLYTAAEAECSEGKVFIQNCTTSVKALPCHLLASPGTFLPGDQFLTVIAEAQRMTHPLDGIFILVTLAQKSFHFFLVT